MEGLLPFLYRAILLHYIDGGRTPTGDSPFPRSDSPSTSRSYYVRLAGSADDFGRLRFAPTCPASSDALL
ncbi:hypothetical protein CFC21_033822 [Triticum aestivum]|uniref:Uncharacterized protein n=3 Tax=Triticum TaxID=4564 RepID=A0A9R0RB21_TRITD|nr:hypothetical protein CFC21_033822 [Triticum aestivum]VAH56507.1 unnamed protein product [Triticum turgidum subsp. durum]